MNTTSFLIVDFRRFCAGQMVQFISRQFLSNLTPKCSFFQFSKVYLMFSLIAEDYPQ